jgi:hypothetical protein
MNLKPIYTILISFCIAIGILGGLYYYGNNPDSINSPAHFKNTVIQLLPRPIIIDNTTTSLKNNALENLLTSKTEKIISIPETDIDFSNIMTNFPFILNKLSMNFRYNKAEERVDFDGQNNKRYQTVEISGHYKHTLYNQIHYVININNDHSELNINALYTPSTKENTTDSVTGQFSIKTHSNNLLKYSLFNEDIVITGNFYKTDNTLKFDKVNLASNTINLTADIEINSNNTLANIVLLDSDLNSISKNFNLYSIYNDLFENFLPLSQGKIKTLLKLQNVTYNNLNIEDGAIQIATADHKLIIENLSLVTKEKAKFLSKGNITANQFGLEYDGTINVTNLSTESLATFIDLDQKSLDQTKDIEIASKIKLSPPLLHLTDLRIIQGFSEACSEVKQYNYNKGTITRVISDIKNFRQTEKPSVVEKILKKYNKLPQINIEQSTNEEFIHAKLNFNSIQNIDNLKIDNVSATYINTPYIIQVSNIETKSNNLNINGNILFDISTDPKANIIFKGRKSDPFVLYSLLKNNIIGCGQLVNCKTFLQNMVKFKGNINFDVEGTVSDLTPISSVNCSTNIDSNINLNLCKATAFDGALITNGNVNVNDKIQYSLNYELLKANAQSFMNNFFTNKIKIDGYFDTIKGFVSSFGLEKETFIKNLDGNADINTSSLKIDKLDFKTLLQKHKANPILELQNANSKKTKNNNFNINNLNSKFIINNNEIKSSHFFFDTNNNIKVSLSKLKYDISSDNLSSLMDLRYTTTTGRPNSISLLLKGNLNNLNLNTQSK